MPPRVTGFSPDDARRVAQATREWERAPKGRPKRRGWRPMATVSAVVRVTSETQSGAFFPGVVQEYDSATNTFSDLDDGLAWVIAANNEALVAQSYLCDLVGESGSRLVWATACCADVGEGEGSGIGTGPADGFAETVYLTITNNSTCPCLGTAPIALVWNEETGQRESEVMTVTCNGQTTEVQFTALPGDHPGDPWGVHLDCTTGGANQGASFSPTSTSAEGDPLSVLFTGASPALYSTCCDGAGTLDMEINE